MLRNAVSHSWNKLKTRSTEQSSRTPHHVWFNKAECVFPVGDTSLSLGLSRRRLPQVRPLTMPSILKGLLSTTVDDDWAYLMGDHRSRKVSLSEKTSFVGGGDSAIREGFARRPYDGLSTCRRSALSPKSPPAGGLQSFGLIVRAFPNPSMAFDLSGVDEPPCLSVPGATEHNRAHFSQPHLMTRPAG